LAQNDPSTLVSLLTPLGQGGISVIALSGPRAVSMILPLFRPPRGRILKSPAPGKLYYGHLHDDDELLDEVLLAFFPPDSSLTGSEMVEINCHGGIAPANAVIRALVRRGAADAAPQDLFRASVDSGKLDPIQAEAALLIPHAPSTQAAALLLAQYRGALSGELSHIAELLASGETRSARGRLQQLLTRWEPAKKLLSPPMIVLAGKTNVGKSTLLNVLLGYERVIASDQPGTTRDYVTEPVGAMNAVLQLVDTAGLHGPGDTLSKKAERRTHRLLEKADVIVFLFVAGSPLSQEESAVLADLRGRSLIPVAAKADLGSGPAVQKVHDLTGIHPILVSSVTGQGIEKLKEEMSRLAAIPSASPAAPSPFTESQAGALREIARLLDSGSSPEEIARRLGRLTPEGKA